MARQYERLGFMFGLLSGTTPHRGDATVINNMQSWDSRHDNTDMWELTQAISETSKVFKQVSEAWKKEVRSQQKDCIYSFIFEKIIISPSRPSILWSRLSRNGLA